jgi:hypothetical protein
MILKQLIFNIFEIQSGNHLGQRHQVKKIRNRLTDDFMKLLSVVGLEVAGTWQRRPLPARMCAVVIFVFCRRK